MMNKRSNSNKIMFAFIKGNEECLSHFLVGTKGDRRTHFEWLSNMYIGWDVFRKTDMGYIYDGEDIIYVFHGNQYQPIEKVDDILSIVRQLIDELGMDKTKTYQIINGIKEDDKPIVQVSINLEGLSNN